MAVKDQIIEFLVKYGFQILGGIIIFICGCFIAGALGRLVKKSLSRFKLEQPVETLLVRVTKLVVILLTGILTVSKMGVDIAPLVAGVGVVGVGVGLATQGVLANLVAGLLIIFSKPFRVGEYIDLLSEAGVVQTIDLFSTKLSHADKSVVIIPNRKIVGEIVHNYGTIRQLDLVIGVSYDSDLDKVERVVTEVLAKNERVLKDPAPVYGVSELADSYISIAVKPWVSVPKYGGASGEIYKAVVEAFRQHNIEVPFPQRQIRILNADDRNSTLAVMPSRTGVTGI
ncbi:MAG TPA: mechanosensitive ion channel family protein [Verrucomicrobiae bacterium]